MKDKNYLNATFVTTNVHEKTHIASVHEGKKQFNCNICDYRCSRNINEWKRINMKSIFSKTNKRLLSEPKKVLNKR